VTVGNGQHAIGSSKKLKVALYALCASLFLLSTSVQAQPQKKIPRIGFLATNRTQRTEAFRQGLSELGYVEKNNILVEYRFAEGALDRLPRLAAELVRLNVEVIVTAGAAATRPAKQATAVIPIVMANDNDPVGSGFVASLARPGGNVTGLSNLSPEISGKQLELLQEIIPKLSRVAVLGELNNPGNAQSLKDMEHAARSSKLQLEPFDVRSGADIESGFVAAEKARADAILVLGGPITTAQRKSIAEIAAQKKIPAIYPQSDYIDAGGLLFYGPSVNDLFRRAATYVDKILKGAKPADLPVERPTKFELVINLKTAKQIGLTIPPNVLARADRVIR
jgi:putative ABC transport system substrate-binding protein